MTARETHYASDDVGASKSSTSFSTYLGLTVASPKANTDYLVLWSVGIRRDSGSTRTEVRMRDGADTITRGLSGYDPEHNGTYGFGGGAFIWSTGASPASTTWNMEYRGTSGLTAFVRYGRILIIELGANDEFIYEESNNTSASPTPAAVTTLTFTPSSLGDYVVIVASAIGSTNNAADPICDVDIDGTQYNSSTFTDMNDEYRPFTFMRKQSFDATEHNISMRGARQTSGGSTIEVDHVCIVALRLDDLEAHQFNSLARQTSSLAVDIDGAEVSFTPENVEHVVIAMGAADENSLQLNIKEGSTVLQGEFRNDPSSNGDELGFVMLHRETPENSTHNYKTTFASAGGVDTVGLFSQILVIQTAAAGGGQTASLGIAVDTSTALALASSKMAQLGIASETNIALSVTAGGAQVAVLGIASETDVALPLDLPKTASLGIAEETDSALSVSLARNVALGIAEDVSAALAVGLNRALQLGIAEETDTALSLDIPITAQLGIAIESDEALSVLAQNIGPTLPANLKIVEIRTGLKAVEQPVLQLKIEIVPGSGFTI